MRIPLLALPVVPLLMCPFDAAWAACSPAAANGVNATCSGTTVNSPFGFGTGTETGASVLVLSGASVTGTSPTTDATGISLGDGSTVTNAGSVSGLSPGYAKGIAIYGNGAVTNSGSVTASGYSAYGVRIGGNGTVTNSGSITSSAYYKSFGIFISGTGAVTNSGSITATSNLANPDGLAFGVFVGSAGTVTNSGSISASGDISSGVYINGNGSVTNAGSITVTGVFASAAISINGNGFVTNTGSIFATGAGGALGIAIHGNGAVSNTGSITAIAGGCGCGALGILITGNGIVTNAGTIVANGPHGTAVEIDGTGSVVNSGVISGNVALQFFDVNNSLTVLPGSTLIGALNLNGAGDTVNFNGGNHNLTFNTLTGVTVTGTEPFAVNGNRAAAVDPTPFALGWRTLNDFVGAVSNALPQFGSGGAGSGGPLAFAAPDSASRIEQAFAAIPGLSAYSGDAIAFKAPTVVQADGSAVWARGFAGVREQPADGVLLHATNQFYGGMIGGDWQARPDLRLGGYAGAGHTRTSIDFGSASDSDLGFAGVLARYAIGASFLQAGLQGGFSQNATSRTINNNLLAGGIEKATASFNGWYVSPEVTVGTSLALGRLVDATYTLTPSLKLRYLFGTTGGYTETGTTAPLTVGARNVNVVDERGELKLTRTVTFTPHDALALSAIGGVQGSQLAGGNTINATLLGQAIPFATPGKANLWGGYGGSGLEWRTGNVSVYSAGEYLALSDGSHVISGRGGLRVDF